jgi:hypothetical protein
MPPRWRVKKKAGEAPQIFSSSCELFSKGKYSAIFNSLCRCALSSDQILFSHLPQMVSRWARNFFSSPQRPNWLLDSPGLLLSWYRMFFTGGNAADVLAIHFNLVLRLRMSRVLPLPPSYAVMACRAATLTIPASLHYVMYIWIL